VWFKLRSLAACFLFAMSVFSDFPVVAASPIMQTARVLQVNGAHALVEVADGGCGRCHVAGGCGSVQLTRLFCLRPRRCRVLNRIGARVGAQVTVALPAGTLRHHVHLAYGLPLLMLSGGALLGNAAAGDAGAAAGAGVGLTLAWGGMMWRARSGKLSDEPYIAAIEFQEEKT
jgi:sigma-E factor negative regulatory protein RseC